MAHGEFGKWLADVEIDKYEASRYIKVYDEASKGKLVTSANLGLTALHLIATLPPEQREQTHTTAKGEEKKPEDMTVKELRQLKKALKAEKEARERAESQRDME